MWISKLAGDSAWAKYALLWSSLQAVLIVALEAVIFVLHREETLMIQEAVGPAAVFLLSKGIVAENDDKYLVFQIARALSVYHVLFMVAQFFQLALLCDAVYHKNTIQIIATVVFGIAMVAYAGVQIKQASDILDKSQPLPSAILDIFRTNNNPYHASLPYEIAVIVLMVLFSAVFIFMAYKLYKEFGWSIYKKIGADLQMRDMYKVYQLFIMILKFDIFFWLGFSAQFLTVVWLQSQEVAFGQEIVRSSDVLSRKDFINIMVMHLVLSTGASIVLPMLAWWGLKRESKIAMSCFLTAGLATLVYNVMKLHQVFTEQQRFDGANKFLTFFCKLSMKASRPTIK
ncbi:hypothetical protein DFQ27_004951 [Actinomortierella ambigua]|uniref:Uncharacterized protein n=1 Tax=Actinomortierella ambigua TaxID=1343610 RepID=A0A9P6Q2V8_9FUNG|nr:hypothetical protein DFQ27_004951 [Actinomortierella ambigua]